jgi:DNA-binding NarL/FixJ family response regulator
MDVLRLIAQGLRNNEIAGRLVISERTVKFHVSSILGKLGASNRTEAVKMAARRGLIDLS